MQRLPPGQQPTASAGLPTVSMWSSMPKMESWRLYAEALGREQELQAKLDNVEALADTNFVAELEQLRKVNAKLLREKQKVHVQIKASADASTGREMLLFLEAKKFRHESEKLRRELSGIKDSNSAKELQRLQTVNSKLAVAKRDALARAAKAEAQLESLCVEG